MKFKQFNGYYKKKILKIQEKNFGGKLKKIGGKFVTNLFY